MNVLRDIRQKAKRVFGKYWKNLLTLLCFVITFHIRTDTFFFLLPRLTKFSPGATRRRKVDCTSSNDDCPWSSTSGEIYYVSLSSGNPGAWETLFLFFWDGVFSRWCVVEIRNISWIEFKKKKIERLWNVIIKSHSSSLGLKRKKNDFCVCIVITVETRIVVAILKESYWI